MIIFDFLKQAIGFLFEKPDNKDEAPLLHIAQTVAWLVIFAIVIAILGIIGIIHHFI